SCPYVTSPPAKCTATLCGERRPAPSKVDTSTFSVPTSDSALTYSANGRTRLVRARDPRRVRNRDQCQRHHADHHRVHLGQVLTEADGAEYPQRQRVLPPRRESGDDHLIETECERQQRPGDDRGAQHRKRDVAKGLHGTRSEVGGGFDERVRGASQSSDDVIEDHHDAKGG